MELTREQEKAVKILIDRYNSGERYSVLSGWAGTGKTTCINFLVNYLLNNGLKEREIAFTAYTGKAVQVMIDKGNKNAVTLHKLLYKATPMPSGKFMFRPHLVGTLPYKVIICDECSMASKTLTDLLLTHGIYTIFIGDDQQLPPIKKDEDNHLLDNPHASLTEIHRQAAESGIIQLSTLIREGKPYSNFKSDDAIVLPKSELTTGMLLWADQIICATNNTRIALNSQVRELKGYTKPIEEGESLICLTNQWETLSDKDNALTNGTIGTITNMFETWQQYPPYLQVKDNKVKLIRGVFISNTGDCFGEISADKDCIITGIPTLDGQQKYKIGKIKKYQDTIPYEFTYSYAVTCWKFQGSSAGKVLGIEEKFPFSKDEHRRYMYTLVTRSEDKCVLITQ